MIYDINEHNIADLLKNERLIAAIMQRSPILTIEEARDRIQRAYERASNHVEKPSPVKSSDHPPCIQCGSIEFQRTGTCFVCIVCGSSQGCS